jgi:hypothetical protein
MDEIAIHERRRDGITKLKLIVLLLDFITTTQYSKNMNPSAVQRSPGHHSSHS